MTMGKKGDREVGKWKFGGRDPKNIRTIVILYDIGKRRVVAL